MASCEKCWDDAYLRTHLDPMRGQSEHYQDLLFERKDNPCTPEEQAGQGAEICPECKRKTVHVFVGKCVLCGNNK